ncbi:MAG: hypothetical protein H0U56_15570 [Methylibium sp.]|nr:hypothetical protein [Methylibium sp.]
MKWISIPEAARAAGVQPQTMRRRLLALHFKLGGGIVRSLHLQGKPRKYWVNVEALRLASAQEPDAIEVELGDLRTRVADLERKLDALRNAYRQLKKAAAASPPAQP